MISRWLRRQKPGQEIQARTINQLPAGVSALSRSQRPNGWDRRGDRTRGFFARLKGNANPYNFTQVDGTAGGNGMSWADVDDGLTGQAWEYNQVTRLDGKVAWVHRSQYAEGLFEFRYNRQGSTSQNPCNTGKICGFVKNTCFPEQPPFPALITVTDDKGNVVGSSDPTKPNLCVGITQAGKYTVTLGDLSAFKGQLPSPACQPAKQVVNVTDPCKEYDVIFECTPNPTPQLFLTITTCFGRIPSGITVTIQPGNIVLTGPVFAEFIELLSGYGEYTVTVTGPRYCSAEASFTVDNCHALATLNLNLDVAPGYICTCACNEPLSRQVQLIDSYTGAAGIANITTDVNGMGITWDAVLSGTIPGGNSAVAPGACNNVCAQQVDVPILYRFGACISNGTGLIPGPPTASIAWGQSSDRFGGIGGDPNPPFGCANGSDPTVLGNVVLGSTAANPLPTNCPITGNEVTKWVVNYLPFCMPPLPGGETAAATIAVTEIIPPGGQC